VAGGKSTAKMEVIPGGAEGSKNALRVTGEVAIGFAFPWSGVMFSPGPSPMAPVNLSARKEIQFWPRVTAIPIKSCSSHSALDTGPRR